MKKRHKKKLMQFILAIIIAIASYVTTTTVLPNDNLIITVVDVGQADATIVQCHGEVLVIDGGNREDSDIMYTIMKRNNIKKVKAMIATHSHEDHVGGLSGVFETSLVDTVYVPNTEDVSKVFTTFKQKASNNGAVMVIPETNDEFMIGEAKVTFLSLNKDYGDNINNSSLCVRIDYGETSFLWMGDAEKEVENDLLDSNIKANVLKVGHHGSNTSSTMEFLQRVQPDLSIISVGKNNSYGLPHQEVLQRYKELGLKVFRTDELGDIRLVSDGSVIDVFSYKKNKFQDKLMTIVR